MQGKTLASEAKPDLDRSGEKRDEATPQMRPQGVPPGPEIVVVDRVKREVRANETDEIEPCDEDRSGQEREEAPTEPRNRQE